jgi:serine/threonine protein phosphatase PrpC
MRKAKNFGGGSCAVLAFVTPSFIHVGNAGDCRAVLCRRDGSIVPMSSDHTPERADEVQRIRSVGGHIECELVLGELPITRSIGDRRCKVAKVNREQLLNVDAQVVTAKPEVRTVARCDADLFILLASDGLWSRCSSEDAAAFVHQRLIRGSQGSAQAAAEALVQHALFKLHSSDNTSVVIVHLHGGAQPSVGCFGGMGQGVPDFSAI